MFQARTAAAPATSMLGGIVFAQRAARGARRVQRGGRGVQGGEGDLEMCKVLQKKVCKVLKGLRARTWREMDMVVTLWVETCQ